MNHPIGRGNIANVGTSGCAFPSPLEAAYRALHDPLPENIGFLRSDALLVVVTFSQLLADYYVVYTNAGNQAETLTGRIGIWLYFLNEAVQNPWIGHGFHAVWKVIPPFNEFEARHAHNELLQQFYAYGAVGVFMLVAIYGSVWRQLRRLSDRSLKIFFFGMLLFVIVRGVADTEPFDLSLPLWFIAIIGALIQQSQNHAEVLA